MSFSLLMVFNVSKKNGFKIISINFLKQLKLIFQEFKAEVFGFDLSENMIEIARNKNREYKIPGVSLINTYLLFRYIFHNLRSIVKK